MPQVSVIIPCYNQAEYLTDSVNSVLNQTFTDWECLIINDGSTDQTRSIALAFAEADERVRYFEQTNKGLAGARNRGLNEIRGRYVQFLDADDWLAPTKFELQQSVLQTTQDLSLSCCYYERHVDDPNRSEAYVERFESCLDATRALLDMATLWETELSIPAHCFLFDARFFTDHHLRFDQTLPNHEDWDCWMQILAAGPKVFNVPEALATYRFRPGSMSGNLRVMRKGFLKAIEKQKQVHADNEEIYSALCEKFRSVKTEYRDFTLPKHAFRQGKRKTNAAIRRVDANVDAPQAEEFGFLNSVDHINV